MAGSDRMRWLRGILLVKVIVTLAAWGLPALVAPPAFLVLFGIPMPEDPIFLRLFGAVVTAFALAYWFAYKDPVKNTAILKVGVLDNGLATLTVIAIGLTRGLSSWFFWVSAVLTAFFCIAFLIVMPRE